MTLGLNPLQSNLTFQGVDFDTLELSSLQGLQELIPADTGLLQDVFESQAALLPQQPVNPYLARYPFLTPTYNRINQGIGYLQSVNPLSSFGGSNSELNSVYGMVEQCRAMCNGGMASLNSAATNAMGAISSDPTINTVFGLLGQAQQIYQGGMSSLSSGSGAGNLMSSLGLGATSGTPSLVAGSSQANPGITGSGQMKKPCSGTVTSEFGPRWGRSHKGIDIGAASGTPINSVDRGTVIKVEEDPDGYGNYVVVDHGNGKTTLYAHCSKINVKPGQVVGPETVIAEVGSTGHSTGPHLHFEVKENGTAVNPRKYVNF